jgi:multiple sugar transport system ATP-binding protein
MEVRYDAVAKSFGSTEALAPLDITVPDGRFLAMLGPSGCGKTTALRLLAGLELPTAGRIFIGERDVTRLEPRHRDIAMVFQSYALYPHKSVAENIAYPLRLRRSTKADRDERVRSVAELLDIGGLLSRTPRQLSGGQRQRVALARAIIRRPQAFLMDEPLSNLDAQLRLQMRVEIKRLQRELGVTTLYVTHDQIEAMTMADLIAVMRSGRLQQLASPAELYAHPANLFVARFCGSPPMNVLDGEMADGGFRHAAGTLPMPGAPARGEVKLGVRPEHLELVEPGASGGLTGEVYVVEPLGNETLVTVRAEGVLLNVRAPATFDRQVGERVGVRPTAGHLHLFDASTGEALAKAGAGGGAGAQSPADAGIRGEERARA